jgi:hypothetical protein
MCWCIQSIAVFPFSILNPVLQAARRDIAHFLSLFEHKARESSKVTRNEVNAITGYLSTRVKPFYLFEGAEAQLRQLVSVSRIFDADADLRSLDSHSTAESADVLHLVNDPEVRFLIMIIQRAFSAGCWPTHGNFSYGGLANF